MEVNRWFLISKTLKELIQIDLTDSLALEVRGIALYDLNFGPQEVKACDFILQPSLIS